MKKFWIVLLILACLLTACKSGGKAGDPAAPEAQTPTAAADREVTDTLPEMEGETAFEEEEPTEETMDEVMLEIEEKEKNKSTEATVPEEEDAGIDEELEGLFGENLTGGY